MGWWTGVIHPVRRVWFGFTSRLGIRKSGRVGLWRLRKEVNMCQYDDVHVMWEMLSRREDTWQAPIEPRQEGTRKRRVTVLRELGWPRSWASFHICRSF